MAITANFSSYRNYITDSLHQWDRNQILTIRGLNLPSTPEVHFHNKSMDRALVRQATMENQVIAVNVPNTLLQAPFRIYANIGIYEGSTFKVVETVEIPVIPCPRPQDYVFEDTDGEVYSFNRLENMIENRATKAQVANIVAGVSTDSELVDVRYGADGVTYASAGEAVREQLMTLKNTRSARFMTLDAPVVIDETQQTITIPKGFFMYPREITSILTLAADIVLEYTTTGVLRFARFDLTSNTADIVERQHIFSDTDVCLAVLYNGVVTPVELNENSVKRVARTTSAHTFMADYFAPMANAAEGFKIVLGGDSITHGVGGTGFAQNGDLIIEATNRTDRMNRNPGGYCWAKLFKEYIETNYNATVTNNGCTGTYSGWWDDYKADLIPADTDLFILTIGTNDRNSSAYIGTTRAEQLANYYTHIKSIVEYCLSQGTRVLLCSSIPASASNEDMTNRLASVFEFNGILQKVASEYNMDYFDLYSAVYYRLRDAGKTVDEYLPDGLHPGDELYKIMFYEYMRGFGLAPSYIEVD